MRLALRFTDSSEPSKHDTLAQRWFTVVHRLRRWANSKPMLAQRLMSDGSTPVGGEVGYASSTALGAKKHSGTNSHLEINKKEESAGCQEGRPINF